MATFKNRSLTPKMKVSLFMVAMLMTSLFVLLVLIALKCLSNRLNAMHPNIKFTVEVENQGSIPFLDVRIIKKQHGFSMGWYHKDTCFGALLHYLSYAARAWKDGLLKVLNIVSQFALKTPLTTPSLNSLRYLKAMIILNISLKSISLTTSQLIKRRLFKHPENQ